MSGLHNLRTSGRRWLVSRRRTPPWVVVLIVATVMFLASVGLTVAVGLILGERIAAIETVLDIEDP